MRHVSNVGSATGAPTATCDVTLEVWAGTSRQHAIVTQQVTVTAPTENQPPVASFTSSCEGTICTLDGSTSTDDVGIVSHEWNLGRRRAERRAACTSPPLLGHEHADGDAHGHDTKGQQSSVTRTVTVP